MQACSMATPTGRPRQSGLLSEGSGRTCSWCATTHLHAVAGLSVLQAYAGLRDLARPGFECGTAIPQEFPIWPTRRFSAGRRLKSPRLHRRIPSAPARGPHYRGPQQRFSHFARRSRIRTAGSPVGTTAGVR
jgi:hypothetical protein